MHAHTKLRTANPFPRRGRCCSSPDSHRLMLVSVPTLSELGQYGHGTLVISLVLRWTCISWSEIHRSILFGVASPWLHSIQVVALKFLALPLTLVPMLMLGGVVFLGQKSGLWQCTRKTVLSPRLSAWWTSPEDWTGPWLCFRPSKVIYGNMISYDWYSVILRYRSTILHGVLRKFCDLISSG